MQIISFDIGIKNMAYCYVNINNNKLEINKLEKIDLNCNSKNIQNIIDNTIEFLDNIMNFINIDDKLIVLIETQMTSIMRCIQTTINTYFKILNKHDGIDIDTIYLSPKFKLNLINKYEKEFVNNDKIYNNKYKQNKVDSILFTKWLLENKYKNENILNYFNLLKKKDDISDSFLMIIYYFENFILK